MSKFVRAAQTSQSLSLAVMEEASRSGLRDADIERLFLALVINDQAAGRTLRDLGITIDSARLAVAEQHDAQLASLGIDVPTPNAGQIVFHETGGYDWANGPGSSRELKREGQSWRRGSGTPRAYRRAQRLHYRCS